MTLYVARHGETEWNVQERYAGTTDIPLNERGLQQAETLADKLTGLPFDVLVCSPQLRARQTAAVITRRLGLPAAVIEELAERHMGVYEGLTKEEVQAQYHELWARLRERRIDDGPTGGETNRQFDARVARALARIREDYAGLNVLAVCHGGTALFISRQLRGLTFAEMGGFSLGNCEVAKYTL